MELFLSLSDQTNFSLQQERERENQDDQTVGRCGYHSRGKGGYHWKDRGEVVTIEHADRAAYHCILTINQTVD